MNRRATDRSGWILILVIALAFAGVLIAAAAIDRAHGMSVGASLASAGL